MSTRDWIGVERAAGQAVAPGSPIADLEDAVAHASPRGVQLRMWASVLVAIAASGLIVIASSYSAFNTTNPNPTTTNPNPTNPNPTTPNPTTSNPTAPNPAAPNPATSNPPE